MSPSQQDWKLLYKSGGTAILLAALIFRRNWSAEMSVSGGFGIFPVPEMPPTSALEWFTLLHNHPFVGLSLLDLFDLINFALVGLFFLALYAVLKNANKNLMLMAISTGLIGVAIHLGSNKALEMLSLSRQYAAAATEAQRTVLLTAGDVLLATHYPAPEFFPVGIHISLFLVLIAGLLISIVMLQSGIFSQTTAICGILANSFALTGFIALAINPDFYWIFPTSSAPFRLIWYILTAIKLFKL